MCLIKSLHELHEDTRANIAREKYFQLFKMPSDKNRLERFLTTKGEDEIERERERDDDRGLLLCLFFVILI